MKIDLSQEAADATGYLSFAIGLLALFLLAGHGCTQCEKTAQLQLQADAEVRKAAFAAGLEEVQNQGTSGIYYARPNQR